MNVWTRVEAILQWRPKVGQTSTSSEMSIAELTLDGNDEQDHSFSVSFSYILRLSKNYLCGVCFHIFLTLSHPDSSSIL